MLNNKPRAHLRFDFFEGLKNKEHGPKRSALLRLAILSSGLSKICGLALQATAIPLVYRSLGQHRYDLYLLLTGALGTIALVQMGAGPGLTQGIAKASAAARRDLEASLLRAAFRLAAAAALIGGAAILTLVYLIPPGTLFGPEFSADRAEIFECRALFLELHKAAVVHGDGVLKARRVDLANLFRMREGQRMQQHRIHHGEDGGVRSDSKREGEQRDGSEGGGFQESSNGKSNVLSKSVHNGTHLQRLVARGSVTAY